jgi:hypothetical protein
MSDAFVIEVEGDAVGLVVKEREGFRFVASNRDHLPLEGRLFRSPNAAERAVVEARRQTKAA